MTMGETSGLFNLENTLGHADDQSSSSMVFKRLKKNIGKPQKSKNRRKEYQGHHTDHKMLESDRREAARPPAGATSAKIDHNPEEYAPNGDYEDIQDFITFSNSHSNSMEISEGDEVSRSLWTLRMK